MAHRAGVGTGFDDSNGRFAADFGHQFLYHAHQQVSGNTPPSPVVITWSLFSVRVLRARLVSTHRPSAAYSELPVTMPLSRVRDTTPAA